MKHFINQQKFDLTNYRVNSNRLLMPKIKGHLVVQMRSPDFSVQKGGLMIIDFLKNGLTKKRNELEINIICCRSGCGWRLIDEEMKKINYLYLETNHLVKQIVGIKNINTEWR